MTKKQREIFIVDGVEYKTGVVDKNGRKIICRSIRDGVPMFVLAEQVKGKYPDIIVDSFKVQRIDGKIVKCPTCTLEEFIATGTKRSPGRPKTKNPDAPGGLKDVAGFTSNPKD